MFLILLRVLRELLPLLGNMLIPSRSLALKPKKYEVFMGPEM